MSIKVAVVDDQLLFRKGMVELLKSCEEIEVLAESGNGHEFIGLLERSADLPEVVLLDLNMPVLDGVETTKVLRSSFKDIRIIILSVHDQDAYIAHLIELGAHGYLLKDADPGEVRKAISSVYERGFYMNEDVMRAMRNALKSKDQHSRAMEDGLFTARELQVLDLICKENTTSDIATKLFISVKTVNGHRDNLLKKAGVRNTAGLVVYAIKKQLVHLDLYRKQ